MSDPNYPPYQGYGQPGSQQDPPQYGQQPSCGQQPSYGGQPSYGEQPTAGGFVVQLLPEASEAEAAMETMTKRLEDFVEVRERLRASDGSPSRLIEQIFEGMPFTWLHRSDIRFGCQCSELRVMTTLSLLDRSEIQELVDEGEPLSIGCDYCGASYAVEIAQLQGLLSSS